MEYRLRYEFAHLTQQGSSGYNSTFTDRTAYLEEPDHVTFTFGTDDDQQTMIDSTGIERAVSSTFTAYGKLYEDIKFWLVDHLNSAINSMQVRLTDVLCGQYLGIWELKSGNLQWCDDGECRIKFTLNEYKPALNCLQNTLIADNHRNWFPEDGIPWGKWDEVGQVNNPMYIHPVFRYCDDIKPQALQNFIFTFTHGVIMLIATLVFPLLSIVNILQYIINNFTPLENVDWAQSLEDDVEEKVINFVQVMMGCNRMHPAPFVRNYFINGCSKCKTATGQRIEFVSDIFNDEQGPYGRYYNTAHLFAPHKKGLLEDSQVIGYKRDWLHDNRPIHTVIQYAYTLKDIFNAKFKLEGNKFYFNRKDTFPSLVLFDFSGADKELLLKPVCYSSDVPKRFASTKFEWGTDAVDMAGNEAKHRYNGAKDWTSGLPEPDKWNFEGIREIKPELYSTTRFATDGIDQKLAFTFQTGWLHEELEWANNAILMEKDETTLGKLLCYDPATPMQDAGVVKVHEDDFNLQYWQDDWIYNHSGTNNNYYIYNWPLFFNENFISYADNLFSLHSIDNPTSNGLKNKRWEICLELCCKTLWKTVYDAGYGDGIVVHLDYHIILPSGEKGAIRNVTLDYGSSEIRLTGEINYT
ncbi:MAG: hypothetical protein JNL72_14945 [Flavipsychrobacter sp.]|nr:hypothetical protein [Flavipsychrobacter sp.]